MEFQSINPLWCNFSEAQQKEAGEFDIFDSISQRPILSMDDSKSVIWERQYNLFCVQFDTRESLLVPLKLHIVLVLGDQRFSGSLGSGFYQNVKVGVNSVRSLI